MQTFGLPRHVAQGADGAATRRAERDMPLRIEPEIGGVSVVLGGDFNPAIFTPAWFALHDLLPKSAADGAEGSVVHPRAAAFTFDGLVLNVTDDRFFVETSQAPYVRVCDLVVRVFRELLPHTPLKAFGINRTVHFRVRNLVARDRIGRTLAPVEPWGSWADALQLGGERNGMMSLTMGQVGPLAGRPEGDQINVTVEPSVRIGEGRYGVYVHVNDHYTTGDTGPGASEYLMKCLASDFEASLERGDGIVDHIMSLAEE